MKHLFSVIKRIFHPLTQRMSSRNICLVLLLNLLLPVISCLLARIILYFQLSHGLVDSITVIHHQNTMLLLLLLSGTILATLDYFAIIKPILQMETKVQDYEQITGQNLHAPDPMAFPNSSWELMFSNLLQSQQELYSQQEREKQLRTMSELQALQKQINPHFLYNTLDSIRGLAMLHDEREIASMTEALSRLFRSMIEQEGRLLPLADELRNISHYITIQKFRFRDRFTFHCSVPESLQRKCMVPNMSLQPLVENAIVHGLEQKLSGGHIEIAAYATEERLVITIWDNGKGMTPQKLDALNRELAQAARLDPVPQSPNHTGIALFNIHKQIQLKFGSVYGLHLESTPNVYTAIEMVLPLLPVPNKEQIL